MRRGREGDAAAARHEDVLPTDTWQALDQGRCDTPFDWLGPHRHGDGWYIAAVAHGAEAVEVLPADGRARPAMRLGEGVFLALLDAPPGDYRLRLHGPRGGETVADAYAFGPLLDERTLRDFDAGRLRDPADVLGARPLRIGDVEGVHFAVWAPHARRVSVVGDFNRWDGRRHVMRRHPTAGVWEIFVPHAKAGALYKFELLDAHGQLLPLKADPFARQCEHPPATASVVAAPLSVGWHDAAWLARRAEVDSGRLPLSIYELHASSWRHDGHGRPPDWDALARQLIPYVQSLGFTHVELLPIAEYPFGGSWGYQSTAPYAPTARMGSPDAFARFVDSCHVAGIGVIVDWVGAHFPRDPHGLQRFDDEPLYEYADPREGFHRDWHTLIYDYGRPQVRQYLVGSALDWLRRFHVDGLRVDAVASMLYRDYSRAEGEWIPNEHGGRENLQAVSLLRELNEAIAAEHPGVLAIAEESTAWPGVTRSVDQGGLGFSLKWNMGWMHDCLGYFRHDPLFRRHHHGAITFGLVYGHAERFVLPLSHDEVVHGKGSLIARMPGDRWQRFANLRACYGLMWGHPGKKLLFMGGEFAQWREWDHDRALDWALLDDPLHAGMQRLVADLNRLLHHEPALHRLDHEPAGFQWVVADDAEQSVFAFLRRADDDAAPVLVVCNLTPVVRHGYRVGVPEGGAWRELCNTDSRHYGGSDLGNAGRVQADARPGHGQPCSLELLLPPLATVFLRPERGEA
ncbi:1,4-alpha-glucan branching protein GlgB [Fulvimonas sp. R45]|uniref:1,4-alpha-glucan branching protein GlgB n=1 Tax=Fulvimonas sp. R45 TaxID=3045937 RepID=UPI0031F2D898